MLADETVYETLRWLVDDRVSPAPSEDLEAPYIVYQQVGGNAINFLSQEMPSKQNTRFQINVWANTRLQAAELAHMAEELLRLNTDLNTTVIGAHTATHDETKGLHGTRQDFYFWT